MRGSTLIHALNSSVNNVGKGSFLHYWNITGRKGSWKIKGTNIDKNKSYKIAITNYLVEKGGKGLGMLKYDNAEVQRTNVPDQPFFKVVIDEFEKEFGNK